MAKATTQFCCQECGAVYPRWTGKCDACNQWNTIVEETIAVMPGTSAKESRKAATAGGRASRLQYETLQADKPPPDRWLTSIAECDRVLGGGFVPASVTLVGGDPGIGKSTLLLQVCCRLAATKNCVYISGEEAIEQIRLRALRLGLEKAPCSLVTSTNVADIAAALDRPEAPELVVIDSIQTMYLDTLESAPGTVAQVRACAHLLIQIAKRRGIVLILVGHVTKEGMIAGPRVLEHMVDTVLYLEGERGHQFRILRAVKNRFGPTDEIGVFEMTSLGLSEVTNPSALFLAERERDVSGAAVFAGMEGTRPVLVEIQALVSPTVYGTPRRAVVGWDSGRLAMVLAVLETRCGVKFGTSDVYLNVAGGLRVSEPAADLAVAAALLSALSGEPVPAEHVLFGEIGLTGEVRQVSQPALRLKEAAKLGFSGAITPQSNTKKGQAGEHSLKVSSVRYLRDLLPLFQPEVTSKRLANR